MTTKQKTLTEEEEAIAKKRYGRNATPTLFEDKTIDGLIRANCPKEGKETGWANFAKQLIA